MNEQPLEHEDANGNTEYVAILNAVGIIANTNEDGTYDVDLVDHAGVIVRRVSHSDIVWGLGNSLDKAVALANDIEEKRNEEEEEEKSTSTSPSVEDDHSLDIDDCYVPHLPGDEFEVSINDGVAGDNDENTPTNIAHVPTNIPRKSKNFGLLLSILSTKRRALVNDEELRKTTADPFYQPEHLPVPISRIGSDRLNEPTPLPPLDENDDVAVALDSSSSNKRKYDDVSTDEEMFTTDGNTTDSSPDVVASDSGADEPLPSYYANADVLSQELGWTKMPPTTFSDKGGCSDNDCTDGDCGEDCTDEDCVADCNGGDCGEDCTNGDCGESFLEQYERLKNARCESSNLDSLAGKSILFTGQFDGFTKEELAKECTNAGAANIITHATMRGRPIPGHVNVLVVGIRGYSAILVEQAKERNIAILQQGQFMALIGKSHAGSTINTHDEAAYEQKMIKKLDEEGRFIKPLRRLTGQPGVLCKIVGCGKWSDGISRSRGMCRSHGKKYGANVPKVMLRAHVLDEDDLDYETADYHWSSDRFLNSKGKRRRMRLQVKRIRRKGTEKWDYFTRFSTYAGKRTGKRRDGTTGELWKRFCLTHDKPHHTCSICNNCTHLDPEHGIGHVYPSVHCIHCNPKVKCAVESCQHPRLLLHSLCNPKYPNLCETCYRIATKQERSEDINAEDISNNGVQFDLRNKKIHTSVESFPDGVDYKSPYNTEVWENNERGHGNGGHGNGGYGAKKESKRRKCINEHFPKKKGKVWIEQYPETLYRSPKQTLQNKFVADLLKYFFVTDLGQRKGGSGKRVAVFVGYPQHNRHVQEALREKSKGYWDKVIVFPRL